MPKNYPPKLAPGTLPGETRVWLVLQKLGEDWLVFHSVDWQGERGSRRGDGEADFVVVHPSVGMIVIEVKGGDIVVGEGQWYSIDSHGRTFDIKDPAEQAMISKKALTEKVKDSLGSDEFVPASHAIALPDVPKAVELGPNAPRELIMSREEHLDPEAFLRGVAEHSGVTTGISEDMTKRIATVLAPSVDLRRRDRDDVAEVVARIHKWTEEQVAYLDDLEDNSRQLVLGGAGTGKTVLAKEKARRLAADGSLVLLTCFNKPLAAAMAAELDGVVGVTVDNFHGLVEALAREARSEVPPEDQHKYFFPQNPPDSFWETESAELLVEAAGVLGTRFDAIVIDEGQDFAPNWFLALEYLLTHTEKSPFYVFADRNQNVYRDSWEAPFEGHTFRLRKNCRNTNPIAERVANLVGDEMSAMGVQGPEPQFLEADTDEEMVGQVRKSLHRLINEGQLEPSQVVVLTQQKADAALLRKETLAGQLLVPLGNTLPGVVTETIHRYKGLEADACIVVLRNMSRTRDRALAYVGLSRARARLVVVGPRSVKAGLRW